MIREKQKLILMVSNYSSYAVKAHQVLKQNFHRTLQGSVMQENCKIISAYKKNPNLQHLLVKAKPPEWDK